MSSRFDQKTKMKIPFLDADPEGYGVQAEWVWVTAMGHDNYRIENHPLTETLFWHDIVKAFVIEGALTYNRVVIHSGAIKPPLESTESKPS